MNPTITRTIVALFAGAALAAGAQAQTRCKAAATPIDQQACAAAQQGPEELRRFVQKMNWMRANLQMADYVDRQTVENWDARVRPQAERDGRAPVPLVAVGSGR